MVSDCHKYTFKKKRMLVRDQYRYKYFYDKLYTYKKYNMENMYYYIPNNITKQ